MKECFNSSEPRGEVEVAGILTISVVALFGHNDEFLPFVNIRLIILKLS